MIELCLDSLSCQAKAIVQSNGPAGLGLGIPLWWAREGPGDVFCLEECGPFHIAVFVADLRYHRDSVTGAVMKRRRSARRRNNAATQSSAPLRVRYAEVLQLRQMILNTASAKSRFHQISKQSFVRNVVDA